MAISNCQLASRLFCMTAISDGWHLYAPLIWFVMLRVAADASRQRFGVAFGGRCGGSIQRLTLLLAGNTAIHLSSNC
jgi:hypothetical protein